MKQKKEKGITLVALVVTVVVLLILAGVSINLVLGENGIITKAKLAQQMSEVSSERDAIQMDILLANMQKSLEDNNEYYVGVPLYDRTLENGDKWNIMVDNDTLKQYGTGYSYIEKGTEISNYGQTQYNWLVNYSSGDIIQLNSNYTALSYKSGLAVTDKLVLNIDATNLENENWGDIVKHGDTKYVKENKSLYFDGDGDYLELTKNADFSNGFTFEFYGNLERLRYDNGSGVKESALFCKMPGLNGNLTQSMRFGFTYDFAIGKFNITSSWHGKTEKMETTEHGAILTNNKKSGYNVNEDFYLTFIYKRYNPNNPEWTEKADKVEYYINGDLYGYTYYGIDSYDNGCKTWNTNDAHFYLGVCPWHKRENLYYLKGSVYCTRLYERALSSEEVKENFTKTQLYRQTQ